MLNKCSALVWEDKATFFKFYLQNSKGRTNSSFKGFITYIIVISIWSVYSGQICTRICKLRDVKQCLWLVLETFWRFRVQIYLNSLPERKLTYRKLWQNQDTLSVLSRFHTDEFISPLSVGPDFRVWIRSLCVLSEYNTSLHYRLFRAQSPVSERRMARDTAQGR